MSLPSLESLAGRILREHAAATISADSAIEHARKAGTLLLEARERCERGKWESWLRENCSGISTTTAQAYMRVARAPVIEADSLREALGKLAKHREPNNPQRVAPRQVIESKEKPSENTEKEIQPPPRESSLCADAPSGLPKDCHLPGAPVQSDAPERPDDLTKEDEEAALLAAERERNAVLDRILVKSGDLEVSARAEIDRLVQRVYTAESRRDAAVREQLAATKLVKTRDKEIASLKRKIQRLETENSSLLERVAIMERAA